MAKDLLDFSKFKKIFEDDKNTHLQHPKGHTIIVAHIALSPKLKKQIADLPMHPEKMVELAKDIMEQMPHHKMAEGGEVDRPFKGYSSEKHARTGGLNDEYREKYNREHGSDLKRPVTGNPKPGSEAAGRKKSFCARMKGVKGPTSEGGELTPKGAALKRWNCHAHGGKIEDTDHDEECMHYAEGGDVMEDYVRPFSNDPFYKEHIKDIKNREEIAEEKSLPGRKYNSQIRRAPITASPYSLSSMDRLGVLPSGEGRLLPKEELEAVYGKQYAEGGNVEKPAVSRIDMNYKDVTKRIPQLTEAANKILSGEMSSAEYDALVNKHKPVEAYGFVPQPATREEAVKALGKKGEKYGKTGHINVGHPTELRLDIPSYRDHGVWINSIHPLKPDNTRDEAVYDSVSSVKNAKMIGAPKQAIKVASGAANKSPFAVIRGDWNPIEEKEAIAKAQKYLKHPEWRQVGYDPERHGYFYDRENMHPIESAEEVLQIGPLVLAKKPVYGKKHEQLFANGGDVEMYAKGGEAARKAAKEYDWNAPAGSQDLFRETPASMFDPEGRKLTKKAQEKKLFGPTGEPDPDTKQGKIYYDNQQKAIARYMESLGVPMVESRGKFQTIDEIRKDIRAANKKRVKAGLDPLPVPSAEEIQTGPDYERSPTTSTLRGAEFYRSILQKSNPKPDWRSGKLEAQRNIGAKVHELGHIPLLPKNIPLGDAQEIMDEGSERAGRLVDPVTGESRQGAAKQIQEEIQSMGAENKFRNAIGIPAYGRPQYTDPTYGARVTPLIYDKDEAGNTVIRGAKYESGKKKGQYKVEAPALHEFSRPRISLDTQQPYATRLKDEAGELMDLIAQSKNMSPETRERVLDLIGGITRMREEDGIAYTPADTMTGDTLVNLRGQGRTQEAEERLRTRGQNRFGRETKFPFAEGGQVGFDAIKKERYYADGGRVMLQSGGDPNDPNKPLTLPSYADPNLVPWQSADVAPSPSPTPEYRGGYNKMGDERHFASSDARGEVSLPQRFHRQNIVQTESGGRQFDTAGAPTTGKSGEIGASQIMPEMAPKFAGQTGMEWNPELFYRRKTGDYGKDYETEQYNLDLGAKAFNHLYDKYEGDMALTIAAYNLGEPKLNAAIEKAQREGGSWLDHVPPRTRRYVYENLAREEGIPNPHEFATKKAGMAPEEAVEGGATPSVAATSPTAPYAEGEFRPGVSAPSHAGAPKELRQNMADQQIRAQIGQEYNTIIQRMRPGGKDSPYVRPSKDELFGPNGEPPGYIDPSVYSQARQNTKNKYLASTEKRQNEITRIQELNKVRAQAGAPLLPVPAAPGSPIAGTKIGESPVAKQLFEEAGPTKTPSSTQGGSDILGPQSDFAQGLKQKIEGTQKIYDAQKKAAEASVPFLDQNVAAKQALYTKTLETQKALENYHTQIANLIMSKEIDPMKVWKDKSTLGKISTVIGMLISGMGAGVLKQENAAYRLLKDQIDASVEAQKANLGRYDNLLKTNVQAMQQTQAGAEMLRAQLGEVVAKQLEAEVKRVEGERLEGEKLKAIGDFRTQFVTTPLQKAAFLKLAYDPSTSEAQLNEMMPTIQTLFPDVYEEVSKRRVPGYGVATLRPLTINEQLEIKSMNNFISNANKLERLVNEYKRAVAIDPTPSEEKAQAISMMAGLASDLAKAHGAEPTEGIMKWLEVQLGSPTSIKDAIWTNQAKLGATIDEMKNRKRANLEQAFPAPVVRSLMQRDEVRTPEYAPTTTESKEAFKKQLYAPPRR